MDELDPIERGEDTPEGREHLVDSEGMGADEAGFTMGYYEEDPRETIED